MDILVNKTTQPAIADGKKAFEIETFCKEIGKFFIDVRRKFKIMPCNILSWFYIFTFTELIEESKNRDLVY